MSKIRSIKILLFVVVAFAIPSKSFAQQDPMYSQYMFNTQVLNPAYVGSWETIGFMALTRLQWAGVDNAPQTNTFSVQGLLNNKKVGLGLSVITDKLGYEKRMMIMGDYSYKLELNNDTYLRFGIKAGLSNYSNDLNRYLIHDPNDQQFQGVIDEKLIPNFGVGAFLHSQRYYFGVSIPKFLETDFENQKENSYTTTAETRHWFVMGGYVLPVNNNIQFKPSFLTKIVAGAPLQVDINANFLFNEKFWAGAMFRTSKAYGINLQYIINGRFRIGYAVDYGSGSYYKKSNGIHEIMLSYELRKRRKFFKSPRYF